MRLPSLIALALIACGSPTTDTSADDDALLQCAQGPEEVFVLTSIRFTRPDDQGMLNGFDLDGATTGLGENSGCGVPDDAAPDGRTGIDNAFAKLLPALALTEAQAIEEIIQATLNDGSLVMLVRLNGADDLQNDTCATLDIVRGMGLPRVGAHGFINAWQTFDEDPTVPVVEAGEVSLVDGTVEVRGMDVAIGFEFLGTQIDLTLLSGALRMEIQPDGSVRGIMGGGIDVDTVLGIADTAGIAQDVYDLLAGLLGNVTDLAPDETGACTQISVSMDIEAVPAFLYDIPVGDTGL